MRKSFLLAALISVVGLSLMVATASARPSAAAKGGTLQLNLTDSDFEYIDPQKCYDTGCGNVVWALSYNLMQYAEKGGPEGKQVYPEAAAAFPIVSKDGKTYTFTVRKGHKASNGKVVTPQWFVRAFERLLSPKMGDAASARFGGISNFVSVVGAQAFYDGKASSITGVQVKGDKFIIKLTRPFPALLSALGMSWFNATDPTTPYSEQDMKTVVGAGPYYVSSRDVGRNVVLDRNKFYKGSRPANADRIVITVNVDENQSLLQVKAGQADMDIVGPPAASAADLGSTYGINKSRFFVELGSITSYYALNTLPGTPFASTKLRQAVNWAVDRPALVRVAGKYAGRRTDQILPPAMPGFTQRNDLYAYKGANPTKAKQVAGSTSGIPTIRILHRNTASNTNRAQLLRYEFEQLGLKVATEPVPTAQLFSREGDKKAGNYDVIGIGWQADYADPSNFINVLFDGRGIPASGSSNNAAYFNSTKFNGLMDKANLLSGPTRFKTYGALDIQIMKEAAPWIPYVNANNRLFVSARTKNFIYNLANTYVALNALTIN